MQQAADTAAVQWRIIDRQLATRAAQLLRHRDAVVGLLHHHVQDEQIEAGSSAVLQRHLAVRRLEDFVALAL